MTDSKLNRAIHWSGPAIGVAILLLVAFTWLQSLWQWPLLNAMMMEYLGHEATPLQVQLATAALLLLNTLWLGCGGYLGYTLVRRRELSPWVYYLCAFTLLFGGVVSKLLALLAVLRRLLRDAVSNVVH
ncbi:hypothetical protein [Ferrimonas balearica]|uniref:hypothetical protein n=1 Tax=Ferrimonas balearica TaxID=44012 RepID=UPI001C5A5DE3|nr:hypothetical protein [Ferrimonas balearica]MBW3166512.1 hypothetical protein [Ferrimonas balearica]MBY5982097.1 hypothetical protein [Ferrimonas balearica]MBY6226006.1 hypothetical protein [Ferrimonas balearica]